MFIIILFAALVLIPVAAFIGAAFLERPATDRVSYLHDPGDLTVPQVALAIYVPLVCGVLLLMTFSLWAGLNINTKGEVASLEAFYYDTIGTYEHTISRTGSVEIPASQPGLLDVAYIGQAEVVGLRIMELRDEVAHFNRRLRWYRTFGDDFIASGFIADLPEDMRPITITELDRLRDTVEE